MGEPVLQSPPVKRKRRKRYKPTHAVQLYDKDIAGVDQGYRCFHVVKTGTKWVHLVETTEQTHRRCEIGLWKKLVRMGREV